MFWFQQPTWVKKTNTYKHTDKQTYIYNTNTPRLTQIKIAVILHTKSAVYFRKNEDCWQPAVDCLYLSLTLPYKRREVTPLFFLLQTSVLYTNKSYYLITVYTQTHESNNRSHFPSHYIQYLYMYNSPQTHKHNETSERKTTAVIAANKTTQQNQQPTQPWK